jgi:hypothetical protein
MPFRLILFKLKKNYELEFGKTGEKVERQLQI